MTLLGSIANRPIVRFLQPVTKAVFSDDNEFDGRVCYRVVEWCRFRLLPASNRLAF